LSHPKERANEDERARPHEGSGQHKVQSYAPRVLPLLYAYHLLVPMSLAIYPTIKRNTKFGKVSIGRSPPPQKKKPRPRLVLMGQSYVQDISKAEYILGNC